MEKDLKNLSTEQIFSRLKKDNKYQANLEFAKRVVSNEATAVKMYIYDLSDRIREIIENTITHRDIFTEYFEFLSKPFNDKAHALEWHKVDLYNGGSRLDRYTNVITTRHFTRVANKERREREKYEGLVEYVDYESLLKCNQADQEYDDAHIEKIERAFKLLSMREQDIIGYSIFQKLPALEIYEEMKEDINPKTKEGMHGNEMKASWDDKKKQKVISYLKGQALTHLKFIFNHLND